MAVVLEELKRKIKEAVLTTVGGTVEIEDTPVGNVHVYVTSEKFAGLSESGRDRLLWPVFEESLSVDEFLRISVCVLSTPEEAPAAIAG